MLITGHSSGIGKALYNTLNVKSNVYGASRSNGYDIENLKSINDLIKENDINCVVNNAYSLYCGQSKLLLNLYDNFPDMKVINVGSISAFRTDCIKISQILYASDKLHLKSTHDHLLRLGFNSKLLTLGMVDTEYNKNKTENKLTVESVIDILVDMIYNETEDKILVP